MATDDQLETVSPQMIPRPRAGQDDDSWTAPEPRHSSPRPRPRSEYWDYRSATWRSRGPALTPRTAHQ
jgi:hypothetical protein